MQNVHGSRTLDLQLQQALLLEQQRRKKLSSVVKAESEALQIFRILRDEPHRITESKQMFKKACETFLWISTKERGIAPFKLNRSQEIFLDAYFEMKSLTPAVRLNILKGRQQGMSTMIGACAVIEMLAHPNTRALIQSEEKGGSGSNIYMMYDLFFRRFMEFVDETIPANERDIWAAKDYHKKVNFGHECQLINDSLFSVVGEKPVTSRTLQFIHLSEAAFFKNLADSLGMLMQTIPATTQSSMFIETTANEYGDGYHDAWLAACDGKSSFLPLFISWINHEQYSKEFADLNERKKFFESLSDTEENEFGNEMELLELDTSNAAWRRHWKFEDSKIRTIATLENLNWRRLAIRNLNGNISEFNRQYPSTPEMAFLSNAAHVLDMEAVRRLEARTKDPIGRGELVELQDGSQRVKYEEQRGGVLRIWEHPLKYAEYIIGVDLAEGNESGDFSCAYVVKRHPFQIVCCLRGYDGRRLTIKEFSRQLYHLGRYYGNAVLCPENNNQGEACVQLLLEWGYLNLLPEAVLTPNGAGDRFGWRSTGPLRELGVGELQEKIANEHIGIPDAALIDEFYHFVNKGGKAQAARKGEPRGDRMSESGFFDDRIFSLIGVLLASRPGVLPPAKTQDELVYQDQYNQEQVRVRNDQRRREADPWEFV